MLIRMKASRSMAFSLTLALGLSGMSSLSADYYDDLDDDDSDTASYSTSAYYDKDKEEVLDGDALLEKRVHETLHGNWVAKNYDHVHAQVKNGTVMLTGFVKNKNDKEKVEKEIREIKGVKKVNSQITVQSQQNNNEYNNDDKNHAKNKFAKDRASTSADEQLNKKIRDEVSKGWLWNSYKGVILNTTNGVVTLEGHVDSKGDLKDLIEEIQEIEGVKSVKSHLKINDNRNRDYND